MRREILFSKAMLPPIDEYYREVQDIWQTKWLSTFGPKQKLFEERLKTYLGTNDLFVFTNGHTALESIIGAMRLKGEVITTPFTFISTAHAIIRNGLTPIFCDINEDMTIDTDEAKKLITDKTSAIIATHVMGNPCDVNALEKIREKYNIKIVYDGAHVFGVKKGGKSISQYGSATMFSFHASKVFNCAEGGAVVYSPDVPKADIEAFRYFGMQSGNAYLPGLNGKMHELTAALGICNLNYLDSEIENRKRLFSQYRKRLENTAGIRFRIDKTDIEYNYIYFYIVVDEKEYGMHAQSLLGYLRSAGIHAKACFPALICDMDLYKDCRRGKLERAYFYLENTIVLPLHSDLRDEDIEYICDIIAFHGKGLNI